MRLMTRNWLCQTDELQQTENDESMMGGRSCNMATLAIPFLDASLTTWRTPQQQSKSWEKAQSIMTTCLYCQPPKPGTEEEKNSRRRSGPTIQAAIKDRTWPSSTSVIPTG